MKLLRIGSIVICLTVAEAALFSQRIFAETKVEPPKENPPEVQDEDNPMDPFFDRFFDDDFFEHFRNPFKEMTRIQKQLRKAFSREPGGKVFDSWFKRKFGGGGVGDIQQREDDQFVYYDVHVDNIKESSVDVQVKDGHVTISGQTEKKSTSEGLTRYSKSRFHRVLPAPAKVDLKKVQIEQVEEKIVIKFPKT